MKILQKNTIQSTTFTAILAGCFFSSIAHADAISGASGLEAMQQLDANLVNQYTFAATATDDKEGSNNLTTTGSVSFADETATLPGSGNYLTGMSVSITTGNSYTLEFLMRPSEASSSEAHIFSGNNNDRFYVYQDGSDLKARFGNGSSIETLSSISTDSAYYVAINIVYTDPTLGSGDDAKYTIDAWVGNQSTGTISQALTGAEFDSDDSIDGFVSGLKIGAFVYNANSPWSGDLDSVAWYDDALTSTEIQNHFSAIPEPGSYALLLSGVASLFVFGARKQRMK
ncbi:LamG-like jellyroll fold domain-containing protein [Coraliomargarita algicola]|uniref:LamG-like jellyroll fold domain-containing protein n=1 Tax=Coraliomargarita algicola TaxID=3092156 RepID=A0ABZ0RKH2_9BACT|nr:PEP-CTERM sorting domain-containing protein [Coraliomargarita sp. J2-16]WPJ96701.1 LamG-like jellyroll fold domain-containing protein [Coraliomargarita sp. J2-16]